ncbi:unnamed protein product [Periconia digitata]|uniref:Uncharacterized protein n=1 Tax=Periconia digitata TaxID=1303443 RepID=A0A9W4XS26_9PLEO|nr:unnamed protein product [Periconia digitata]
MPSLRSILLYGLSTLSVASAAIGDASECDVKSHGMAVTDSKTTGRSDGEAFCTSKIKQGKVINGMECWADKDSVRGLKFYYTDESEMMIGKKDNLNGRVVNMKARWNPTADRFEHLQLWDNGWGGMIGRIDAKWSNGQAINCGREAQWGGPTYEADRGAGGMLIGADGGVGDGIDNIRFYFTATAPSRVTLRDLVIPGLNTNDGLKQISLKTLRIINRFENDTLKTKDFDWREKVERKRLFNFQETKTFGFDQTFGIQAGLPKGASIESTTSFKWETSEQTTKENIDNMEDEQSWGIQPLTINPGKAKVIEIKAIKGTLENQAYTAKMEVTFKDSSKFTYQTKASFGLVQYTSMDAIFSDEDADVAIDAIGGNNVEVDTSGRVMTKNESQRANDAAKTKPKTAKVARDDNKVPGGEPCNNCSKPGRRSIRYSA